MNWRVNKRITLWSTYQQGWNIGGPRQVAIQPLMRGLEKRVTTLTIVEIWYLAVWFVPMQKRGQSIFKSKKWGGNLSFDYLKERLKDALTGQLRCSSPAPTDSLHLVAWLTLALFINDSTRINPKFLSFQSFYKSLKVFPIEIKDGILFPLYSIHQAKSAKQPFKTTWDHQYCKHSTETQ